MEAAEQIRILKEGLADIAIGRLGNVPSNIIAQDTLNRVPLGVPPPVGKSALMYPDRRDITTALEQLERTAHQLLVDTSALRTSLERFL